MAKFYAIKKGIKPGIYNNWDDAKRQVQGFKGAIYKSFTTKAAAQAFIDDQPNEGPKLPTEITLYTDGGSRNHGNVAGGHVKADDPAAWAYLLIAKSLNMKKANSGGEFGATNNRMEIMALLEGLNYLYREGLNERTITVVTDSKYVLDSITKGWLAGWQKNNWKKATGELKNVELWQAMANLLPKFSNLDFEWTKGHAINPGNIFVDELLNKTMDSM